MKTKQMMPINEDRLYEEFYDPKEHFAQEPRAFCYELATELIDKARRTGGEWYLATGTKQGLLLLLYTWNFAARETKKLNYEIIGGALNETKDDLRSLENVTITNADAIAWECVKRVFGKFKSVCGQTGASKALSLLNPHLFVMCDTAIRKRLKRQLIQEIGNGETDEQYIIFLKGVQGIIKMYSIADKLPFGDIVAKKFDEYNYVRIVMNKNRPLPPQA